MANWRNRRLVEKQLTAPPDSSSQPIDTEAVRVVEARHLEAVVFALGRLARDAASYGREWIQISPADASALLAALEEAQRTVRELLSSRDSWQRKHGEAVAAATSRAERAERLLLDIGEIISPTGEWPSEAIEQLPEAVRSVDARAERAEAAIERAKRVLDRFHTAARHVMVGELRAALDSSETPPAVPERAAMYRQMSRADRRANMGLDGQACDDGGDHRWQPVSFVFESQLLDRDGRVRIRQPDLHEGRVYVVCMECRTHTYVVTEWAGYYLGGPDYSALGMEDTAGNLPDDEEADHAG